MQVLSVSDLWEDMLQEREKTQEARCRIDLVDGDIVIHVKPMYDYIIPGHEIISTLGAIRHLRQVHKKPWCDAKLFQQVAMAMQTICSYSS